MIDEKFRTCSRCIMTEKGDPFIIFDKEGICNYCKESLDVMSTVYFPDDEGKVKLDTLVAMLKDKNKNKKYDCIMGISGGLDSSYLAYICSVQYNLRIKGIHISDGFDTEIALKNIECLCDKAQIDIEYIAPDEKQFCELTRAYMLAGVPNLAVPQDNVFLAALYKRMRMYGLNDFMSGYNFSLENILQKGNTWDSEDLVNIKDINRRFGRDGIDKLPLQSITGREVYRHLSLVKTYTPLDFIDYNYKKAIKELEDFCGFQYYESKHLENYLTGFLQLYWLPRKFGVNKRTSHLSSMIVTGQITREEAIKELDRQPCSEEWMGRAIKLIKEKMDLSDEEFEEIMRAPVHQHTEYKTDPMIKMFDWIRKVRRK